ncbi:MBL fold metallo-hydrolase [Algoriphagus pacificus]|uniref:MBL fold metallo-hydrolase n=1 Tax=Algoriphagus pacificus TaxID=2811234 RepID=A0ABS3CIP3_9BACT|nr:MBL fold metallo-hydrolase [Algoriphagus pacificus]MBN7816115.1 MBL fold metallo-hydrolase [Algoriphagus pacificus]
MKKLTFIFLSCLLFAGISKAQSGMENVTITSEQLAPNIYVLFGSGGNIGLAVGENYAYMIDDQFGQLSEKILAAVRKITDKPLKYVVNTHWHGDHTGGNENMAKQGAILVANDAVRKRMSMPRNGETASTTPYLALPEITFTDEMTIHLDPNNTMMIFHMESAHTDGDSFIYFPEKNVIHLGDNFPNGGYPFIDINSNGDIEGLITNLNRALFLVNDQTKIIPGHGKVSDRATLKSYRDMIDTVRERVKSAKSSGKSLEEVQKMGLSKEWDEEFGKGFINSERFIESVFKTVDL